jgi:glycosyltransferase involved in cell wall biosynthesis
MGRLVSGKGADHLIQAVARARGSRPVRLLVAGDGPDRPRLAALANEHGVEGDVEFLGVVDDVPAFWVGCDVAVVPSAELHEAFSMVTLEAMACGKPVVATRSGAIPELVSDGETGRLVDRGDVGALAEAMVAYAEDPGTRVAHGAAARRRASERFHIEDSARAYLAIFSALATGRREAVGPWRANGTR